MNPPNQSPPGRAARTKPGAEKQRRSSRSLLAPATATAVLTRIAQQIEITPPCDAALADLKFARHVAAVHGLHGFLTVPWPETFHEILGGAARPSTVMPAGLEPVALELLSRAGISVTVEGRDLKPLPPPGPSPVGSGWADPEVLDFVGARERGLIRIGTGVSPARLVSDMHKAFPDATIAVVATRRDDVRRFGRELKLLAPETFWSARDDCPADAGPLVVTTFMGLGQDGVSHHRRDFLICLDAREALGNAAQLPIATADRARLFGLLGRDERLAPYDRDRAWARFGPDAIDVPRHGCVARPVAFTFARIEGGPVPAAGDVVARKRAGLWANPARNRRIARLAVGLAEGRDVAGLPEAAARSGGPGGTGVIVLVEGVEHALALADLLPGWGLLAGPDVFVGGLSVRHREALAGRPAAGRDRPTLAIATLAGLAPADVEAADAVVRADGGLGVPGVLADGAVMPGPGGRPLLVVDLDDRRPELRPRVRDRRAAYLDRGWAPAGIAPASLLEVFLATRPRGRS